MATSQQMKKHLLGLDQKHVKKVIRSIEGNLNRNGEAISLRCFSVKKVSLKIS